MNAVVIGLGFGDEGKGSTVNHLVNKQSPEKTLVVRFNSGPQAGHTVIHEDRRHVFSSFGSGTLAGAATLLSRFFYIDPGAFMKELELLKDLEPKVLVHPECPMITPYDIWANRNDVRNLADGTCGIGFGKAAKRMEESPHILRFYDLLNLEVFVAKMESIRKYYNAPNLTDEIHQFYYYWVDMWNYVKITRNIGGYSNNIIFEGAQGIMLDREAGAFPHVTRSHTTLRNVETLCKELSMSVPPVYYVTRAYLTRHGNGPLPGEDIPIELINTKGETNITNEYQGKFRVAPLNLDLIEKSLWTGPIPPNSSIIVTCLDQIPDKIKVTKRGVINEVSHGELKKMLEISTGLPVIRSAGPNFVSLEDIERRLDDDGDEARAYVGTASAI